MSPGRQQAGQHACTLTGPPQRGHGIAPSIGVDQSFQCLKQLGVTLDQRLASGSGVPDSPNGEGALRKALDGPIDGRARKTSNAGDDGNTSSSQLLGVERSHQMLLSLIQVRKQRVEFMLKFFCCAHAGSIAQRALCVIVICLRALTIGGWFGRHARLSIAATEQSLSQKFYAVKVCLGEVPLQWYAYELDDLFKKLPFLRPEPHAHETMTLNAFLPWESGSAKGVEEASRFQETREEELACLPRIEDQRDFAGRVIPEPCRLGMLPPHEQELRDQREATMKRHLAKKNEVGSGEVAV